MLTTWDGLPVAPEPPFGVTVAVWRELGGVRQWLLLHRAHHGPAYEGDWAWTPPAGARLPDESVEACARRELAEETGLELSIHEVDAERDWALFVAQAPAYADVALDAEHDAFAWLPLEAACGRCLPPAVADGLRAIAEGSG